MKTNNAEETGCPERPNNGFFDEPWQAQVFALTVALNEAGHLDWNDWAHTLSSQLLAPDAETDGSDYYERWTEALQRLLVSTSKTDLNELDSLAAAWQRAAIATPHGSAIVLENDPETSHETGSADKSS